MKIEVRQIGPARATAERLTFTPTQWKTVEP